MTLLSKLIKAGDFFFQFFCGLLRISELYVPCFRLLLDVHTLYLSAAVAHQADILDELEAPFIYTHLALSEDLYHVLFSLFFSR